VTGANQPYQYTAYGVIIQSAIPLSEFLPDPPEGYNNSESKPIIVRQSSSQDQFDSYLDGVKVYSDPTQELHIYRLDDGFFVQYADIGYLRTLKNEIVISPNQNAHPNNKKWLVANLGLRLVLIQRGNLVFHASAVLIDDFLVAFTGPSGRGKSTLAAACYAAGHVHHSDDLVPISVSTSPEKLPVPPGPARMRINEDVKNLLQLSPSGSTPGGTKSIINTADHHSTTTKELEFLYLLEKGDSIAIEEVTTHSGVFELLRHSYALYGDMDAESAAEHFDACGMVAESVEVRRLARPRSLQQLDQLVTAIETDVSR
jgi:hypothetical protein